MAIPVYRQNPDHGDWEVASVYASDDCDSLGRSGSYDFSYRLGSRGDPAFQLQGPHYDDTRPRADFPVFHPQQRHRNYFPMAFTRPRRDTFHVPGNRGKFSPPPAPIVPPPGMIFPANDWVLPPEDMYAPSAADIPPPSKFPVNVEPPPPLLLSPSSPLKSPSPLIMRPTPIKGSAHGQAPHMTTGLNVNTRTPPIPPSPPRYHDLVHNSSPRLAGTGCQAHVDMAMMPRRPGHDVLSSCGPEAALPRPQITGEMRVSEERYGGGGGQSNRGPGDRSDLHVPSGPNTYEHDYDAGHRPPRRERRPSMWQRFARRFSQSRGVSAGHT